MKPQYLYFPSCKIADADLIKSSDPVVTCYIKSIKTTPSFYPQHEILKGKAEFFFKFKLNEALQKRDKSESLIELFGADMVNTSFKKIKALKKQEVSVIAFFNPDFNPICECLAIGKKENLATFFNLAENLPQLSYKVYLEYTLAQSEKKDKLVKI